MAHSEDMPCCALKRLLLRFSVRSITWIALVASLALLAGCAATPVDVNREMTPFLDTGDSTGALSVLRSSKGAYAEKNELLYRLEEGMLLHARGRPPLYE